MNGQIFKQTSLEHRLHPLADGDQMHIGAHEGRGFCLDIKRCRISLDANIDIGVGALSAARSPSLAIEAVDAMASEVPHVMNGHHYRLLARDALDCQIVKIIPMNQMQVHDIGSSEPLLPRN